MHKLTSLIILIAMGVLSACSEPSELSDSGLEPLFVPAGDHAMSPRLSGSMGDLVLSWLVPGKDGTTLRFSRYIEGQWSPARTVVEDVNMFANWADLPSVVPLGENRLAAHWLVQRPHNVYSYDVAFTQSGDAGQTWSTALTPHSDGTPTEHGFVSMFPHEGEVGLIWLDGRKMAGEHDQDDLAATGMTLRAAFVGSDQMLQGEQIIDDFVCDCCQTDVAMSSLGPIVVYRNRSRDEIRDIYMTRYVDRQWEAGRAIADDGWHIEGCPVNGPAIDASGQNVAIAWFSAADSPVVRLSLSADGGENFSAPIDIGSDNALGRVGVALLDDGRAAVSWLQKVEGEPGRILVRQVSDGKPGPIHAVTISASSFSVPQMDMVGSDLVFAWTELLDDEQTIVSARLPFASLLTIAD